MPCYSCITYNRGSTHVSQHRVSNPESALRAHISEMPFSEYINPIGEELYWLQSISTGKRKITLDEVPGCGNTWKWPEGENHPYPYITFIVLSKD